jgi:hypothetical protein
MSSHAHTMDHADAHGHDDHAHDHAHDHHEQSFWTKVYF